jgi:hypothetical protein
MQIKPLRAQLIELDTPLLNGEDVAQFSELGFLASLLGTSC